VKKHLQPEVLGEHPILKELVVQGEESEGQPRMDPESSWLKKLTGKLRKSFLPQVGPSGQDV
jgi:hypothetical protein